MTDFYIDSDTGRIGKFWWVNSDQNRLFWMGDIKPYIKRWFRHWGSCGYGHTMRIQLEPIDD